MSARLLTVFATAALTAAVNLPNVVLAQQASGDAGALPEVIVTAQKREQNAQDVGISLSALSGADLAAVGAVAATDITKTMPAVILTQPNGPSSFSLSIRGVTQNDFADHQESPAAIYVDDAYVSQMAGLAFNLFDVDRVEVLRGPQGTLFGRNATGGLAHFISRRPTDETSGYFDVTMGQRNLTRVEGALGGQLFSNVDGRIAFQTNHYDALFKNYVGAADLENGNDWAVRGQLLFKFGDAGNLLAIGRVAREDVHAGAWESRPSKFDPTTPGSSVFLAPGENFYGTCPGCNSLGFPASGNFGSYGNAHGFARLKNSGATLKYTYDFGINTLTVIGDYQATRKDYAEDSDTTPLTFFQFFDGSAVHQKSGEVRINGKSGKLAWTGGLYYLDIDGHYYEGWTGSVFWNSSTGTSAWPYGLTVPGGDGGTPLTTAPYDLTTKSSAAFGQLEFALTDRLGLTVGARFTKDKKDYTFSWAPQEAFYQAVPVRVVTFAPPPGTVWSAYASSLDEHFWSGKVELDFKATPDVLLYASVNRGVKAGGFNAPLFPQFVSDTSLLPIKHETLNSFEVGFKSEWLDHRIRLNGAAYYYDYKDFQALTYTFGLNQLIRNADATHKGAEIELTANPTPALRVGLGLAYVDAIVKNVDARGTGVVGNFIPGNASKWSGNALIRYTWPLMGGNFALQADGNFLSRFYFNIADTPVVAQPGYGLFNIRANYTTGDGKIEYGAALENVADRHYAVMGFDLSGIDGITQSYPGMPRWAKFHVSYHF